MPLINNQRAIPRGDRLTSPPITETITASPRATKITANWMASDESCNQRILHPVPPTEAPRPLQGPCLCEKYQRSYCCRSVRQSPQLMSIVSIAHFLLSRQQVWVYLLPSIPPCNFLVVKEVHVEAIAQLPSEVLGASKCNICFHTYIRLTVNENVSKLPSKL